MNHREASPAAPAYELKNELARLCLPSAGHDANLKLAWTNSVCVLFLLIGIVGARRGLIAIQPAPPLAEIIPVVVEPAVLPPQPAMAKSAATDSPNNDTAPVAVVLPQMPNINFSVPTIGTLVAAANLAAAPPLEPLRVKTPLPVGSVASTGGSGERPEPPYPRLAQEQGEQGTVNLVLHGDETGNVLSVAVTTSSGYPLLDRATRDFVKRHWRLPTGPGPHQFQTSITYRLQF